MSMQAEPSTRDIATTIEEGGVAVPKAGAVQISGGQVRSLAGALPARDAQPLRGPKPKLVSHRRE